MDAAERRKSEFEIDEQRTGEFVGLIPQGVFRDVAREHDQINCDMDAESREELIKTTGNPPHPEYIKTEPRKPRTSDQIQKDAEGLILFVVVAWIRVLQGSYEIAWATRSTRHTIGSVSLDDELLPVGPHQGSGMEQLQDLAEHIIGKPELDRMFAVVVDTAKLQIDKFYKIHLPRGLVVCRDDEGYYIV